jgi:hypothetical protein
MPISLVCKENTYVLKVWGYLGIKKWNHKVKTKKSKHKVTAPSAMDDGVKRQAIFPGGGKILYSDTRVFGSGTLRPSQKGFSSC